MARAQKIDKSSRQKQRAVSVQFGNGPVRTVVVKPPPPGHCSVCHRRHRPEEPHDPTSLPYQISFRQEHGRGVTWKDALGHCPETIRRFWRENLQKRSRWTEPGQG